MSREQRNAFDTKWKEAERAYENRKAELHEIARGAIERHLGDVAPDEDEEEYDAEGFADRIYDEAFVLAHDALIDKGVDNHTASIIAAAEAQKVAQP